MNQPFKYMALLPLILLLAACKGLQTASSSTIPLVDLDCVSSQASDCSILGHAKNFRVGIVTGIGASCSNLITQAGSDFHVNFAASGTAESEFTGSLLRGTVSSWVDSSNTAITGLASGQYTICSYLDTNENSLLDSGEPFSQKEVTTLGINQLIDNWGAF